MGKKYVAVLDVLIDGANNTELIGTQFDLPFTAAGNDQIEFFISETAGVGLFANGKSFLYNILFQPYGSNGWNNPQEKELARKMKYAFYGGSTYVVEYLYSP